MEHFTAGTVTAELRRKAADWDVVTFSKSGGSQIHLSGLQSDAALDVVGLVNQLGHALPSMSVERAAQLVCAAYRGQPDPLVSQLMAALNSAQQMLMSVACQPSDVLCEQLRANLRAEAIRAVEVLRGVEGGTGATVKLCLSREARRFLIGGQYFPWVRCATRALAALPPVGPEGFWAYTGVTAEDARACVKLCVTDGEFGHSHAFTR